MYIFYILFRLSTSLGELAWESTPRKFLSVAEAELQNAFPQPNRLSAGRLPLGVGPATAQGCAYLSLRNTHPHTEFLQGLEVLTDRILHQNWDG